MTKSQPHWELALAMVFWAVEYAQPGLAQVAPTTILEVDVENYVAYFEDTSDLSKFAADPNPTTPVRPKNFEFAGYIGDIVAVNGQLAKETLTRNVRQVFLNTAINPGQAIADTVRQALFADTFEILKGDGTPIGTIVSYGAASGSPPPGAPLTQTGGNSAITGGTGAFLGGRGQVGEGVTSTPVRQASITEDPANRQVNRGGKRRFVLHVIPMSVPQIVPASGGPGIFHSDFSQVTAAKPAKPGEVLIVKATGLGPTVPGVNPGQPFPIEPLQPINSPVAVMVNGQAVDVVNSVGWPDLVDTYRVDFRVPDGATGAAVIQLSAAWIAGPPVNIPIQ